MKTKFVLGILLLISIGISLSAQEDSTFISYYYPNSQTHPYWSYFNGGVDLKSANVFETYDNNFVLQSVGTFHYPPPEVVYDQSPMMLYNRQGVYQSAVFGPVDGNGSLLQGRYVRIIKDGLGGYLALNSSSLRIDRLDSTLNYVDWVTLEYSPGVYITPQDILPAINGFIVMGNLSTPETNGNTIYAKFNYLMNIEWHYQCWVILLEFNKLISTSDGGYLFSWSYSPFRHFLKVNASGDSLWYATNQTISFDSLVESDDKYYGLKLTNLSQDHTIRVYSFGPHFSTPNPENPILTITTYNLYQQDDAFGILRTSDNDIVLIVSTPNGEIFKYDSDFNLIWSADYLVNERIGVGKTPVIELSNGDLIYCARTFIQGGGTDKFVFVRIDSNGHITPISDEYQEHITPKLLAVYPNPFTHSLNIELKSEIITNAEIAIYNIKGQLVESFILKSKTMPWIPKNLISGIYTINLLQNKQTVTSVKITYIR